LKLIIRLIEPTSGRIDVDGKDTREWDRFELRRRTGYVLQDVGLFPHMTVAQNIGVVPALQNWPRERIDARVRELLTLVALDPEDYAHRTPDALSGGQRQRVGVARALAADPPVLLMDEPFGALDPITRVELHREFRRIQAAVGKTVLLVTHDMREAFALASRIGVLDGGRLIAYDTPGALRASSDEVVRLLLDSMVGA
jgi:osmoprotectant transport system ATP-binding protein